VRDEHNLIASGILAFVQRFFGAADDGANGVLIVNHRGGNGDSDMENVSPKGNVRAFDHFTKTLGGFDGIGLVALRQDAEKFVFDPMAEEIVGTQAIFESLRGGTQRGVDGRLAKTFLQFRQVVHAKGHDTERHGIDGVEREVFMKVSLDHAVIQNAGEWIEAAKASELIVAAFSGGGRTEGFQEFHGAEQLAGFLT
jgi:hypothetical protein